MSQQLKITPQEALQRTIEHREIFTTRCCTSCG
jgi:hypothetical protein